MISDLLNTEILRARLGASKVRISPIAGHCAEVARKVLDRWGVIGAKYEVNLMKYGVVSFGTLEGTEERHGCNVWPACSAAGRGVMPAPE